MVSIIIPVHNGLEYTKQCIESIKKHTKTDHELIIVDNASTDGTEAYVRSLKAHVITNKKNLGWCVALNQGYAQSKGEYILFLNNDTVISDPDWLDRMIGKMNADTAAIGPTSNYVMGLQQSNRKFMVKTQETYFLIGFCMLCKREALENVAEQGKIIDERFGLGGSEEIDLCIRFAKAGYKLLVDRETYVHHHGSKTLETIVGGNLHSEGYKNYILEKDTILREKWDDETVNKHTSEKRLLAIGLPNTGVFPHRFVADLLAMRKPENFLVIESPRGIVHTARNKIVEDALKYDTEYLLFLDDDTLPTKDLLQKLFAADKDIIGPIVHRRKPPYAPCVFKGKHKGLSKYYKAVMCGVQEVDVIGMAATLIRTDVFRKILKDCPENDNRRKADVFMWYYFTHKGEDFNFCEEARKSGFKIWCDTDITLNHMDEANVINRDTYMSYLSALEERDQINKANQQR